MRIDQPGQDNLPTHIEDRIRGLRLLGSRVDLLDDSICRKNSRSFNSHREPSMVTTTSACRPNILPMTATLPDLDKSRKQGLQPTLTPITPILQYSNTPFLRFGRWTAHWLLQDEGRSFHRKISNMKLQTNRYGKARVRVFKKIKRDGVHVPKELDVKTLLQGDFGDSYTKDDNKKVIATDSIKNTTNVIAYHQLDTETEPFAIALCEHYLNKYSHVTSVEVETLERVWERQIVDGQPSGTNFINTGKGIPWTRTMATRDSIETTSGVRELVVLKTAGSAWEDFWQDEFATLPDTNDRLLATSLTASWIYQKAPASYATANANIIQAMLETFATRYSPSAQSTQYHMGEAALEACPEISQISLTMPNLHYLVINLTPFKIANDKELFVPTDAPSGWIEATVAR
jgi:urate oxidase